MNRTEQHMVDVLRRGAEELGFVSVKAEFEAEGTRFDELLRLVDVARTAGLGLTLKIGGCEAVRDLQDARQLGCRWIVAPMVETPYALTKFLGARDRVYAEEVPGDTGFLANVETDTSFENREELYVTASAGGLDGLVFGRVDFSASQGRSRAEINNRAVTDQVVAVARGCAAWSLDLVVGGGVSLEALPALKKVAATHLTRFETRKVVLDASVLSSGREEEALMSAVQFELLWLTNKRDHYGALSREDGGRIAMLSGRTGLLAALV